MTSPEEEAHHGLKFTESFQLPVGVPVANYSGRPEAVLTAEQWDELKRCLEQTSDE